MCGQRGGLGGGLGRRAPATALPHLGWLLALRLTSGHNSCVSCVRCSTLTLFSFRDGQVQIEKRHLQRSVLEAILFVWQATCLDNCRQGFRIVHRGVWGSTECRAIWVNWGKKTELGKGLQSGNMVYAIFGQVIPARKALVRGYRSQARSDKGEGTGGGGGDQEAPPPAPPPLEPPLILMMHP